MAAVEGNPFADTSDGTSVRADISPLPDLQQSVATIAGRWPIRSQIFVLTSVLCGPLILGLATYYALVGVRLAADGLDGLMDWSWVVLAAIGLTVFSAVIATICLVRTQCGRILPATSVVLALALPPLALLVGVRAGAEAAIAGISGDLDDLMQTFPAGPVLSLLASLLGW